MSYFYLQGLLYSIEKRFPRAAHLERMLEAPTLEAALQVLKDTEYQMVIRDDEPAGHFNDLVFRHLQRVLEMFRHYTNRPNFAELLALEFDLLELNDVVLGVHVDHLPGTLMALAQTKLKEYDEILHSDRIRVRSTFATDAKRYLDEIHVSHVRERAGRETAVLQAYYHRGFKLAKLLRSAFIRDYFKYEIDVLNLMTLAKQHSYNFIPAGVGLPFLEGGEIDRATFDNIRKDIISNLKQYGRLLGNRAERAIAAYVNGDPVENLEREMARARLEKIESAKHHTFTAARIFGYWKEEVMYADLIRMILTAKASGVAAPLTRQMVFVV